MSIYTPDFDDEIFIEMRLWMKQNPLTENDLQNDKIPAWNKGIPNSPETRRLCSIAAKKKIFTDEMRDNYRQSKLGDKNPNYGKELKPQHKENIRLAVLGKKKPSLTEWHKNNICYSKTKIICPHCGKQGGAVPMKRWHFNNCKNQSSSV